MSPKLKRTLLVITILLSVTLYTYDVMLFRTPQFSHFVKVAFLVTVCLLCIYRQWE